ncbi:MAG: choice-of-anchor C family protein [Pyrinomonadaceae bacterium]
MTITVRRSLVFPFIIMCLVLSTTLSAQINNGSFENGSCSGGFTTLGGGSTNITGWLVGGHSVDYICSYWQASDGARSVDLNGSGPGLVSQSMTTVPGWTYQVDFDLSANPDTRPIRHPFFSPPFKTMTVDINGSPFETYQIDTSFLGNTLVDMNWEPQTFYFTASGASTLVAFRSETIGYFGPAIDNVEVSLITQVCYRFTTTYTPDPSAVAALLADDNYTLGPCPAV